MYMFIAISIPVCSVVESEAESLEGDVKPRGAVDADLGGIDVEFRSLFAEEAFGQRVCSRRIEALNEDSGGFGIGG